MVCYIIPHTYPRTNFRSYLDFFSAFVEPKTLSTAAEHIQIARDLVALKFALLEHLLYIHMTTCQFKLAEQVRSFTALLSALAHNGQLLTRRSLTCGLGT